MRPNFVVAPSGETTIVRKPKIVSSPDARGRGELRRQRTWYSRMEARIRATTDIRELKRLMDEAELAPYTRPWDK